MKRLNEIDTKIKKLEGEAGALLTEKVHLEGWTTEQSLAAELFQALCHNKADTAWYYEITNGIHNWSGQDHGRWILKARRAINAVRETLESTDNNYVASHITEIIRVISK